MAIVILFSGRAYNKNVAIVILWYTYTLAIKVSNGPVAAAKDSFIIQMNNSSFYR